MIPKQDFSLQAIKVETISKEGLKHFHPKLRRYFYGSKVYRFQYAIKLPVTEIDTEQKIAQVVWDNWGAGEFLLMGRSHGKNKYHNKPVRLCRIIVHQKGEEDFSYEMYQTWRLRQRYKWFYTGL